jgi:hypothetical protein
MNFKFLAFLKLNELRKQIDGNKNPANYSSGVFSLGNQRLFLVINRVSLALGPFIFYELYDPTELPGSVRSGLNQKFKQLIMFFGPNVLEVIPVTEDENFFFRFRKTQHELITSFYLELHYKVYHVKVEKANSGSYG